MKSQGFIRCQDGKLQRYCAGRNRPGGKYAASTTWASNIEYDNSACVPYQVDIQEGGSQINYHDISNVWLNGETDAQTHQWSPWIDAPSDDAWKTGNFSKSWCKRTEGDGRKTKGCLLGDVHTFKHKSSWYWSDARCHLL